MASKTCVGTKRDDVVVVLVKVSLKEVKVRDTKGRRVTLSYLGLLLLRRSHYVEGKTMTRNFFLIPGMFYVGLSDSLL